MKNLAVLFACLIFPAIAEGACSNALTPKLAVEMDDGISWPKYLFEDADCTPIPTEANKVAKMSTTSATNGDFVAVTPSANVIAFSTTAALCTYANESFSGCNVFRFNGEAYGLRKLLFNKFLLNEYLVEVQKELTAQQALGAFDGWRLIKIQRLKSIIEFGNRIYSSL